MISQKVLKSILPKDKTPVKQKPDSKSRPKAIKVAAGTTLSKDQIKHMKHLQTIL